MATPLVCLKKLPPNENQLSASTSSAKRKNVSDMASSILKGLVTSDGIDRLPNALGLEAGISPSCTHSTHIAGTVREVLLCTRSGLWHKIVSVAGIGLKSSAQFDVG